MHRVGNERRVSRPLLEVVTTLSPGSGQYPLPMTGAIQWVWAVKGAYEHAQQAHTRTKSDNYLAQDRPW